MLMAAGESGTKTGMVVDRTVAPLSESIPMATGRDDPILTTIMHTETETLSET